MSLTKRLAALALALGLAFAPPAHAVDYTASNCLAVYDFEASPGLENDGCGTDNVLTNNCGGSGGCMVATTTSGEFVRGSRGAAGNGDNYFSLAAGLLSGTDWTTCAWVKDGNSVGDNRTIFEQGNSSSLIFVELRKAATTDVMTLRVDSGGCATPVDVTITDTDAIGTAITHWCVTASGASIGLYKNASLVGGTTVNRGAASQCSPSDPNNIYALGAGHGASNSIREAWQGQFDEVLLLSNTKTATQICDICRHDVRGTNSGLGDMQTTCNNCVDSGGATPTPTATVTPTKTATPTVTPTLTAAGTPTATATPGIGTDYYVCGPNCANTNTGTDPSQPWCSVPGTRTSNNGAFSPSAWGNIDGTPTLALGDRINICGDFTLPSAPILVSTAYYPAGGNVTIRRDPSSMGLVAPVLDGTDVTNIATTGMITNYIPDMTFQDLLIQDSPEHGMYIGNGALRNQLLTMQIYNSAQDGLFIEQTTSGTPGNMKIIGGRYSGNAVGGIVFWAYLPGYALIDGVEIDGNNHTLNNRADALQIGGGTPNQNPHHIMARNLNIHDNFNDGNDWGGHQTDQDPAHCPGYYFLEDSYNTPGAVSSGVGNVKFHQGGNGGYECPRTSVMRFNVFKNYARATYGFPVGWFEYNDTWIGGSTPVSFHDDCLPDNGGCPRTTKRCAGGSTHGAACTVNSQCPSGSCGTGLCPGSPEYATGPGTLPSTYGAAGSMNSVWISYTGYPVTASCSNCSPATGSNINVDYACWQTHNNLFLTDPGGVRNTWYWWEDSNDPLGDTSGNFAFHQSRHTPSFPQLNSIQTSQNTGTLFTNFNAGNYTPLVGSDLIGNGRDMTTAVGAGTASTTLIVKDAKLFHDRWGGFLTGDYITVGNCSSVEITTIPETGSATNKNTMTLASACTWSDGAAVNLTRLTSDPYIGAKPPVSVPTPTPTATLTATPVRTATPTVTPTITPLPGATATVSVTPTPTFTAAPTATASPIPVPTSSVGCFSVPKITNPNYRCNGRRQD